MRVRGVRGRYDGRKDHQDQGLENYTKIYSVCVCRKKDDCVLLSARAEMLSTQRPNGGPREERNRNSESM